MRPQQWGRSEEATAAKAVPSGLTAMGYITGAGAPVDGVTGAGVSPFGSFYLDSMNGQWYTNEGTKAVPAWHLMIQG